MEIKSLQYFLIVSIFVILFKLFILNNFITQQMWEKLQKKCCNDHSIIYTLFVIEAIKATIFSLIPGDIDFKAYMEQAGYMDAGERDYSKINSKMGIMCYPAIHAYIHMFIYYITSKGTILKIAQLFSTIIHFINIYTIVKISEI